MLRFGIREHLIGLLPPTAIANMAALSQRYGASHLVFVMVPLVGAFFIDLANALMIPFFLGRG